MKKFITLLLVLALTFSLFAGCKKKNKKPTSESTPPSSEIEQLPAGSTTSSALASALASQFSEVSSFKLEISVDVSTERDAHYYDETEDGTQVVENDYSKEEQSTSIVFEASIDDNDKLDAKISATSTIKEYGWEDETESGTVYVIDNVAYSWNEYANAWVVDKEGSATFEEIAEIIKSVKDGSVLSATDKAKLFSELGELVNTKFNVKDYKGTFSFDVKDELQAFCDYLENINPQEKTLASLIEDGLKLIDKNLTIEKCLDEVKGFVSLTVNEAIAKIDEWLTKNYQTTIQGIYDSVVTNDQTVSLLVDMMGVPEDQRENVISTFRSTTVAELITANEIGSVKLYDLLVSASGEGDVPDIDSTFDMIKGLLDTTISEFEEEALPMPIISIICVGASGMQVNKFDAKMDIKFTDIFRIESINGEFNVDVVSVMPSEVEGEEDRNAVKLSIEFDMSDISKTAKTIEIPAGDKVLEFFADGDYGTEDGDAVLWVSQYDGEGEFDLSINHPSGECVEFCATIPVTALENPRIEVTPEQIYAVYVDYEFYEVELEESIIVEIIDNETFVIVQMPDIGIAEHSAYYAILDIKEGGSKYILDPNLGIEIKLWAGSFSGQILYNDTYPIESINFDYEKDYETGNLICTIKAYGTTGNLYNTETGKVYTGSVPEQIPTLFGGDIEFTFYVTEDGIVTCDDMPEVLPEYIVPRT